MKTVRNLLYVAALASLTALNARAAELVASPRHWSQLQELRKICDATEWRIGYDTALAGSPRGRQHNADLAKVAPGESEVNLVSRTELYSGRNPFRDLRKVPSERAVPEFEVAPLKETPSEPNGVNEFKLNLDDIDIDEMERQEWDEYRFD